MLFSSMQIVIQMDRATKRIEPWKIAVIVVSVIVGLALVIGLITYFLCHGKCTTLFVATSLQESVVFCLLLWSCLMI